MVGISVVVGAKVVSAVDGGVAMLHREVLQQVKSPVSVYFTELNGRQEEEAIGVQI